MHAIAEFLQRLPAAVICLLLGLSVATESALTFGMVLPGTTALLVLGFMANTGYLPFAAALITATASSIAGTTWAYIAGRRLGAGARSTRWGRRIGADRWRRADELFSRRGRTAVFAAQFIVIARTLVPRIAGMNHQPYRTFAAGSLPAIALWAPGFTLAGYAAGASYAQVSAKFGRATGAVVLMVALVVACVVVGRWVARHPLPVHAAARAATRLPGIRTLARSRAHWFTMLAQRLPDRGALAVNLALTVLLAFGLAVVAILTTDHVGTRSGMKIIDRPVARWMLEHRDYHLYGPALELTSILRTSFTVIIAGILAALAAARRGRRRLGGTATILAVGGAFLPLLILTLALEWIGPVLAPPGPAFAQDLFPKQIAVVTCALGLLAYRIAHRSSWHIAATAWTAAALLCALLALARIYIGITTTTETLADLLLGIAWTVLIVTASHPPAPTPKDPRPAVSAAT